MRIAKAILAAGVLFIICSAMCDTQTSRTHTPKINTPGATVSQPKKPAVTARKTAGVWDGFRGLRWGTNIRNTTGLNQTFAGGSYYTRKSDKLTIGGAKLTSIYYVFYENRFHGVVISTKGASNWRLLKAAVSAHYGKGKQGNRFADEWGWPQDDVEINLDYNKSTQSALLTMFYVPITKEEEADKTRATKEAAKDF